MSSEPPAEEAATETDRLAVPGHTRGNVACGATRCDAARQSCIGGTAWSCVPRGQDGDLATRYDCDDASDCPAGKTCCLSFASAAEVYACSPRSGPDADCRLEVCVEGEGAAPCPPGQRCTDGVCRPKALPALCAGQRCSASLPICVWSEGRQSCQSWEQAQAERDAPAAILRCSEPRDCGAGFQCCTNALWDATHCSLRCDAANNGVLCTRPADCGKDADGKPLACRTLDQSDPGMPRSLPPWIKVCQAN